MTLMTSLMIGLLACSFFDSLGLHLQQSIEDSAPTEYFTFIYVWILFIQVLQSTHFENEKLKLNQIKPQNYAGQDISSMSTDLLKESCGLQLNTNILFSFLSVEGGGGGGGGGLYKHALKQIQLDADLMVVRYMGWKLLFG